MGSYSEFSDVELAGLLKQGDKTAFTEIYRRFFKPLYIHAYKRLKDEDEATDVVQDLFEFLWAKRAQLDITTKFSSYLYAAVRNRVFTLGMRSERKSRYLESLGEFINKGVYVTDEQVRERELSAIIEKEISLLPPQMRKVFEMSRKDGLSHKQIAAELGTSEHTVRDQVKKSIKILRQRLGLLALIYFIFF